MNISTIGFTGKSAERCSTLPGENSESNFCHRCLVAAWPGTTVIHLV